MYTIDEVNEMLDAAAAELPEEIFMDLNGGVSLLPETKYHNDDPGCELYTLGQYRHDQLGRYIVIYYGSLCRTISHLPPDEMRERLRKLLAHELTHHLEALAGERGLELQDERELEEFRRSLN